MDFAWLPAKDKKLEFMVDGLDSQTTSENGCEQLAQMPNE
jgi:hypothetical protein